MQQTSILAWINKAQPKLSGRQNEILGIIREIGPINNRQLAEVTRIPINAIPAPVLKLRKAFLVELAYKRIDPVTDTLAMYWRAVEDVA